MYYVIELQTNADGTTGNLVYAYNNRADADDKFLATAWAAVKSAVMIHAVAMIDSHGRQVREPECYVHPVEVTPEPGE